MTWLKLNFLQLLAVDVQQTSLLFCQMFFCKRVKRNCESLDLLTDLLLPSSIFSVLVKNIKEGENERVTQPLPASHLRQVAKVPSYFKHHEKRLLFTEKNVLSFSQLLSKLLR